MKPESETKKFEFTKQFAKSTTVDLSACVRLYSCFFIKKTQIEFKSVQDFFK